MPADDCPSFHCRPSTAMTLLPRSLSMRQVPTTGTSDLGSAPTVSSVKSILVVCCAASGDGKLAALSTETIASAWGDIDGKPNPRGDKKSESNGENTAG